MLPGFVFCPAAACGCRHCLLHTAFGEQHLSYLFAEWIKVLSGKGLGRRLFQKDGRLLAPLLALYVSYNQRQRRRRSRQNSVSSSCESQTWAASVYGGQWSSIEPAAASGRRHSRPVAAGCRLSLPSRRAARARFARGRGCHRPRRSAPGRTDSRRCPHCAPPRRRCRGRRPCRRRPD